MGKTTFCDVLLKKYQIPSYSASRLISKRKAVQFNANKKTGNIPGNQSLLVDAIREFELGQEQFLLDGHFCLVRDDGGVARIPETTFVQLMPAGIVVLTDSAANIAQRVEGRDGVSWTRAFVEKFQQEELAYSNEIAETLNVPYLVHRLTDPLTAVEQLLQAVRRES